MRDGFERALKLLARAECEHCNRPLTLQPLDCPDVTHSDTATQIAELKKLLASS
jgi:hypothetical protein